MAELTHDLMQMCVKLRCQLLVSDIVVLPLGLLIISSPQSPDVLIYQGDGFEILRVQVLQPRHVLALHITLPLTLDSLRLLSGGLLLHRLIMLPLRLLVSIGH